MMRTIPVPPSIDVLDPWQDVHVHMTFKTVDAPGQVEVAIAPYPEGNGVLLQLIDAAIVRLLAYRDDFMAAEAADMPVPPAALPVPWHAWTRR